MILDDIGMFHLEDELEDGDISTDERIDLVDDWGNTRQIYN